MKLGFMFYHCIYNSYSQWFFLLSFLTAMKILLFLHFIYSLCLFFNLIKALAAHFLCPQTTFFGTELDLLKNKKQKPQHYNWDNHLNWLNSQLWKEWQSLYSAQEHTQTAMQVQSRDYIFSCFDSPRASSTNSSKFSWLCSQVPQGNGTIIV